MRKSRKLNEESIEWNELNKGEKMPDEHTVPLETLMFRYSSSAEEVCRKHN